MKVTAMFNAGSILLALGALAALAHPANACTFQMEPSPIFGSTCNVLVGYYEGDRVGPFHTSFSDGSFATAGTCEGYVHVDSFEGNTVSMLAFHQAPARTVTLHENCIGVAD
jgi:hypothetical protein